MQENIAPGFTAVDNSSDPDFYVNFLTAVDKFEDTQSIKQKMRAASKLSAGISSLDIGCGHGTEVLAMADVAGPRGKSVGIDPSTSMIEVAAQRTKELGLSAEFAVGDVHDLKFADNSFDVCRAERVFMYLSNPEKALGEMIRVTKPDGRIVIFDFDWDCAFIDGADITVTRKLIRFMSESFPNGKIGSQLFRYFVKAGLKKVISTPHGMRYPFEFAKHLLTGNVTAAVNSGVISAEESRKWWTDLETANKNGEFFAGSSGFIIQGQK